MTHVNRSLTEYVMFDDFEVQTRWVDAQVALRDFQSFLARHVPVLRIEQSQDVLSWQRCRGVYLNYDELDRLLYLGFTLDCFQNRDRDHRTTFQTTSLDLIVFTDDWPFLAPRWRFSSINT